jgi:dihydrodipicolinate synthase/N-acetylneuraminate lyase
MTVPPTGTVTFLFTDIEGSTKLWERDAPAMQEAFARHAEGVGVDAVLVVSPLYWKVGEEVLFRHFAAVAESVDIPVPVYNLPMLTGIDLSPSLIARIAAECPNVTGLKKIPSLSTAIP